MPDELKIQVRFPTDVWQAIKQFAREDEHSFNAEVLWILKRYIQRRQGELNVTTENKGFWSTFTERAWQENLTKKFRADWFKGKRHWLVEVAPGGGKTLWALFLARWLLDERLIKRVVILCPTLPIREQWINHTPKNPDGTDKFPPILQLTCETNKSGAIENPEDFHGIALTYAQLASGEGARLQSDGCSLPGTLVIADEIHHVGRKRAYGQAYIKAFTNATAQIGLTGTPWTSEGAGPIPYVEYGVDDKVKNDGYQYTRTEAIQDDVLRQMQFYAFDAEIKLQDLDTCVPMEIIQKLSDPETENSQLLDYCLYPGSAWMKSILREADNRLLGIIHGTDGDDSIPDAKGLVTAKGQRFAEIIRDELHHITRQPVALIISDNKAASDELTKFRDGKMGRWAVSVNKISEGVDIKSLFVGVYVTNINTPKFWRQFVGRFERKRHPEERNPMVFFPATETLMGLASKMNQEIPQPLEEWELPEREYKKPVPKEENDWGIQTSEAELHSIIEDDRVYRPTEQKEGIALCEQEGIPTRYALKVYEAWQKLEKTNQTYTTHASTESSHAESLGPQVIHLNNHQLKQSLKADLNKLVKQVAYGRCGLHGDFSLVDEEITKLNTWLIRHYAKRDKMSIEQLREAREHMQNLKDELIPKQQQFGA